MNIDSLEMQTHADGFIAALADRKLTYTCDPKPEMRKPSDADYKVGSQCGEPELHYFVTKDDTYIKVLAYLSNAPIVGKRVKGVRIIWRDGTDIEKAVLAGWLMGDGCKPIFLT